VPPARHDRAGQRFVVNTGAEGVEDGVTAPRPGIPSAVTAPASDSAALTVIAAVNPSVNAARPE